MSHSRAPLNASVRWAKRILNYLFCLLLASFIFTTIGHAQPHLVFVVGENEYRSEVTMPALAEVLADHYGFRTTLLIDDVLQGGEANNINGLEALETADILVLYLRFRQLPDAQLALLQKYIDRAVRSLLSVQQRTPLLTRKRIRVRCGGIISVLVSSAHRGFTTTDTEQAPMLQPLAIIRSLQV